MKKYIPFLVLVNIFASTLFTQSLSDKISQVHSYMNVDSVTYFVQSLENYGSRFQYNENRKEIANWLKDQFTGMGYEQVELDSFLVSTRWNDNVPVMQYNVVATLTGTTKPNDIYIIGGHYDSFNQTGDPHVFAPGADDNASGTASALETARAIKLAGYQPSATIKFVCFAAEELMLSGNSGSEYMAAKYREQDINLKLMINNDMIANNPRPLNESMVSVNYYTGNEYLKDIAKQLVEEYTVVTPMDGGRDTWTDSRSFHEEGFPAIYYDEYDFSPNYHTSNDVIANCDMEYCTEIIKASSAMLIYSIEAPGIVNNLNAYDVGDGASIQLSWSADESTYLTDYKIYVGNSESELNYYATSDTTFQIVSGLEEGNQYYFGVSSVDQDGNESITRNISAVPNSLPLTPAALKAEPKLNAIELSWDANTELDLLGYRIYKVPVTTFDYFPPLTFYTADTSFIDEDIVSGMWYEYFVYAFDADSNYSIEASSVTSRAVTLDKGILFVNETLGSDGSPGNPSLEQLSDFYLSLPESNYEMDYMDVWDEVDFNLAHLGAHQTVIWHIDKSADVNTYQYIDVIKEYLDYGGNLLFTGYKPSKAFANSTSMINEYQEGSFIYDYLKISSSENSLLALNKGAKSESNVYPDLELDPEKINSADGHIKTIEAIFPVEGSNIIYSYQSEYDSSNIKGSLKGKPIGLEYLSNDYNIVLLTFPLYYIEETQAQEFLNYVLKNKFDTPTGVKDESDDEKIPTEFYLSQNYPNPFNPTTTIKFTIPNVGHEYIRLLQTKLIVYDILGREVKTLVNEVKSSGTYEVEFDASDLPSGVYLYRLQSANFSSVKKLMLLK
ncbi:MAG: M20/M25/M40 family metallo-hydrolase [Melioribacteraceae bacterium]|jgi:hypothetical protein|nr:M20/M25/M40 family metallo-hydrolase [Melioribacteraceae bacterium]RJP60326.1 MAG: M20/M25/M40 family metallo-hydrolase [Ignavibacteriales bacterium]WKZ68770.1 MAG: M20/M25/M40 family metallo-hydrolase [Melioribacteraceae bacterium]